MLVRKVLFRAGPCLGLAACLCLALRAACPQSASFHGHAGRVTFVLASPDGKTLASLSQDRTLKLWDVDTRKERATRWAHPGHAAFSPNGKVLASAAWDERTVRLWDVATGKELAALPGRGGVVWAVAFSSDGQTLASGSEDGTVTFWDVDTGRERASYRGHAQGVTHLAFSPDGLTLASGCYDGPVKLWDLATGKVRATLWGHRSHVECVAFSPDGTTLASGDGAGAVKLWDVRTGTHTATLDGHWEEMASVVFSPDGKTLATLCIEDTINLWDVASGKNTGTCAKSYHRPRPRLLRFLRDFVDDHPGITVAFPGIVEERTNVPLSLVFTPEGRLVALGYDSRDEATVKMWKVVFANGKK